MTVEWGNYCEPEPVESTLASILGCPLWLAEITLCHTCSCHEILRMETLPVAQVESILAQRNPTCDLSAYVGGLEVCKHMYSLLDADQEVPWTDQPLRYWQKYHLHHIILMIRTTCLDWLRFT
eukprot:COSAG01_NODE_3654_length_5822_cov_64.763411_4_plen_123_part_00